MIKFFRKIRKRLIINNKFSKYLIYAIGEIVLVVIGILIALQINNWNEFNKSLESEQLILKDLKNEMSSNISKLEGINAYNKKSLRNAEFLCSVYDNPELVNTINNDSLFGMLRSLPGAIFVPENGILNSIINSGQIKIIRNSKLKNQISSLEDHVEWRLRLSKNIQDLGGGYYLDKIIYPKMGLIIKDGIRIEQNSKDIFEIPSFFIAVCGTFRGRRGTSIEFEKEIINLYRDVLIAIDEEILED